MSNLLTVRDLSVTFHFKRQILQAVRGATFSLNAGEAVGLVGESGCGKSMLAQAILRLVPKNSCSIDGEVFYNDIDLLNLTDQEMQKIRGKEISMIFQDPMAALNPTMPVGLQIVEGYLHHFPEKSFDAARKRTLELFELVGINEPLLRFDEYPHTMSGGMRQRILIALALASNPQILIADEPTTSLDVTIQAQILDLLKQIQIQTNTSILFITHDLSLVARFCDRALVMYAGKIVETASCEELFSSPQHPYTQRLLQAIPRLDMDRDKPLVAIEGTPPDPQQRSFGCAFCARCFDAMKICKLQDPPLIPVEEDHAVACWKLNSAESYATTR